MESGNFIIRDLIWSSWNKRILKGISTSLLSTKAYIWAIFKEVDHIDLGIIINSIEDLVTIWNIWVEAKFAKQGTIVEVRWNFPLQDGSNVAMMALPWIFLVRRTIVVFSGIVEFSQKCVLFRGWSDISIYWSWINGVHNYCGETIEYRCNNL